VCGGAARSIVVVASAATLHTQHVTIDDASDAAKALEPLAGHLASELFAVGLIDAALLATSILPLSTAYSVSEFMGRESALDDTPRQAPLFYGTYALVAVIAMAIILVPGAPLISILVLTQVLNAVLPFPLLAFMYGVARNRDLMGDHTTGPVSAVAYLTAIAFVTVSVAALGVLALA
jgi:Mn2+/Fe2+ NRAMP family transporter